MSRPPIERIRLPDALPEPISHYTDAVRAGDTVWVSGLLAVDPAGALVGDTDVVAQAEQIFRNLAVVLEHVGASTGGDRRGRIRAALRRYRSPRVGSASGCARPARPRRPRAGRG
ncbi:MAG: RidA family protein [Actinomycetota bacterium]|nr:RidA family protein [Actinomycetota bacterium]